MQTTRRWWLLALGAVPAGLRAQSLTVRLDADRLRVSAGQLGMLEGRPLERLHNGEPVTFAVQLAIHTERSGPALVRELERFAISFDLWEERFAVARLGAARRSATHLTAAAAEAWCLENVSVPVAAVRDDQPFWVRLDFRAEERRESALEEDTGLSLTRIIDVFSRRPRDEQLRGTREAGPFRLSDLRKGKSGK